jgi:glutamate/tyrosine decarboxylase-like PLP-dependent enzyme
MGSTSETDSLLRDALARALRYLDDVQTRGVAPRPEAVAALSRFDEPLPEGPGAANSAAETLRLLDEVGAPATMAMAGPRFFGFVIGGGLPVSVAANWLTTVWDQNSGLWSPTPATATLEEVALRWLVELLGLPAGSCAGFVTGATVANLTGLAAARHAVLRRAGWNVEADGLFGAPPVTVVLGEEAHPTVRKSLGLLGFGRERVVIVPADGQGRMRADALSRLLRSTSTSTPTIVCAQAGNVNTGAFDPLREIVAAAHAAEAWVHVDGAFGLWAQASPTHRHLAAGIAGADSWATDGHKWLNVPYDSGIAFCRDVSALRAAMAITAEYLPTQTPHRNPSDFTPELSRRARGVDIWAALRTLGRSGVAELIDRTCRHARRFAEGLSAAGYRVLNEVVLNQVLIDFGGREVTQRVIAAIQDDGTCWCGGTVWQGQTAMRISVCSWATTEQDVEKSLQAMLRAASAVRGA